MWEWCTYLGDHLTWKLCAQEGDLVNGVAHIVIICG
jgi:hypothetical protein